MSYAPSRPAAPVKNPPLFPPAVAELIRRVITKSAGVTVMGAGGVLMVALLSYNPADPSLNTATDALTVNNAPAQLAHWWPILWCRRWALLPLSLLSC